MRAIILLGPPGAGKGTQAAGLAESFGIPHISTGAILRDAAAGDSELGRRAGEVMAAGRLVDDRTMLGIVEERLSAADCASGFILDGYPRNEAQARALEGVLGKLGAGTSIVNLVVPRKELLGRIRERRLKEGRQDDSEAAFRERLEVYEAETRPLLDHYCNRVSEIDGSGSQEQIRQRLLAVLPEPGVLS